MRHNDGGKRGTGEGGKKARRRKARPKPRQRSGRNPAPRAKADHSRTHVARAAVLHHERENCEWCDKRPYYSLTEAETAMQCGMGKAAYECPDTPGVWHLTHNPH